MHPPRFARPHYIPYPNQFRPHGIRFGPTWPMPHNYPTNLYPRGRSNFPNNNEDHWCETCDRGFRTLELLVNHQQQHQKCNIDGCQFIAHPKVITKHIQMQHSTGLYKKIAKLDNPEEIRKWREERKKRYPTKENIEKRDAEIKEKIDRGEKMGMRFSRRDKPNQTEQGIKRKYNHDMNRQNFKRRFRTNKCSTELNKTKMADSNVKHQLPKREKKSIPVMNDTKTLKPFTGILNLIDDTDNDHDREEMEMSDPIENDEYTIINDFNEKNTSTTLEPAVCGALTSLISNYESSDEELDNKTSELGNNKPRNLKTLNKAVEQIAAVKPNECLVNNATSLIDIEKSDDDSGPEEAKIVKGVDNESVTDIPSRCKPSNFQCSKRAELKNRTNNTKNHLKKFKPKLPSTLLEKLLHSEIRQERNIVLQSIRYIVKNNYFEKTVKI